MFRHALIRSLRWFYRSCNEQMFCVLLEFKPHHGLLTLNTLTYLSSIRISDQYCVKKVQNNQIGKRLAAYRNPQLLGFGSEVIFLSVIFTFYPALSKLVISFTQKFYFANLKKKECSFRISKPCWLEPCTNTLFLLLKMC